MTVVLPTKDLEFEIGGSWVSMWSRTDERSGIRWRRGTNASRQPEAGTLSFSLDNRDELLTPTNTASAYHNLIAKGTGVRLSTTYSGTTRVTFRGEIADITYVYPQVMTDGLRVEFEVEGIAASLADDNGYTFEVLGVSDVQTGLNAIMAAAGSRYSGRYSFAASDVDVWWIFPVGSPLDDLGNLAASDVSLVLFEDREGRMRTRSLVGGNYGSPDHTWGATIAPDGDVVPDYRRDSQVARATVSADSHKPSVSPVTLYRYPFNEETGVCEVLLGSGRRVFRGQFDRVPYSVSKKFVQTISAFVAFAGRMRADITAAQTYLDTEDSAQVSTAFEVNDEIRIDNEVMLVTAVSPLNYGQRLTVTRGYANTTAAVHTRFGFAVGGYTLIYMRGSNEVLSDPSPGTVTQLSVSGIYGGLTYTFAVNTTAGLAVNDYIKIRSEIMRVSSVNSGTSITCFRGELGTTAVAHPPYERVYRRTIEGAADILGASYVIGSDLPGGTPHVSGIVGAEIFANGEHIQVTGRDFVAGIRNSSTSFSRYVSELVIGGLELTTASTSIDVTFSKAVPYLPSSPARATYSMPYGAHLPTTVNATAVGLLRAARQPAPWLTGLRFTANQSDRAVSLLTAEIGDLVRYTGTGPYREDIDEWFRIMAVGGEILPEGDIAFEFDLAPDSLFRDPSVCLFTDYGWGDLNNAPLVSLGQPVVEPVGGAGWTNDLKWILLPTGGAYNVEDAIAASRGVYNVGADGIGECSFAESNAASVAYGTSAHGVGFKFRCNSTESERWEILYNRTLGHLILRNTTDGAVVTVTGIATMPTEIRVQCQGERIRAWINAEAHPRIDTTSTRFQTNTYAGPHLNRTVNGAYGVAGHANPYFRDTYWQRL